MGDSVLEFSGAYALSDTAVSFDGYTGNASTSAPGPVDTTASFSVSAWVNYADAKGLVAAVSQLGEVSYLFALNVGLENRWTFTVKFEDRTGGGSAVAVQGAPAIPGSNWTHLVGVHDREAGMLRFYVDGEEQGEAAFTAGVKAEGPLVIGRAHFDSTPGNFWPGAIGEVAVYQTALTAGQVAEIYQMTKPTSPPPAMPAPDPSTYGNGILNGTWDYVMTAEDRGFVEADLEAESGYDADELRIRFGFDNHEWWQGFVFDGELWLLNGVPEGDLGTFTIDGNKLTTFNRLGRVTYEWTLEGDSLTTTVVEACEGFGPDEVCWGRGEIPDPGVIFVTEHTWTRSGDEGSYAGPDADAPPAQGAEALELKGHKYGVWGVAFSPDGKYLATGSDDGTARLWDPATGEEIRVFSGATGPLGFVSFAPDGKHLAAGSKDGRVYIWDVASGETAQILIGNFAPVPDVAFSPDGKFLATAGGPENTARIWDLASGKPVFPLTGHTKDVPSVAYSPDGKYVLTGSEDGAARLWDATNGNDVRVFSGHTKAVFAVAFSADGKYVATGSGDLTARVWDLATGEMLHEFSGHEEAINDIAFSPDGRYLLTGSQDSTARLWDVATGKGVGVYKGHYASVEAVAFSPDGSLVATGSDDRTARVWNLEATSVAMPAEEQPDAITLRLAVADGGFAPSEPYVLEFVEQVRALSGGQIIIEPLWEAGNVTDAGYESGTIQLVREGDAELGLTGARAWDTVDVPSFQALQAPFLIDTDALARAVATSDVAGQMLDDLSAAGIVGLTLWPEDLRHLFSVVPDKPILVPEDVAGLRVRVIPSEVSNRLVTAMGGIPMFADTVYQAHESGLRQASTGLSDYETAAATGNVTLFSKFQVLFANQAAFDGLSEAQRAILRDAASAIQAKAIAEQPGEAEAASAWCANGGTVVMASDEQLAAFQAAAQPVLDWIEQDPESAAWIAAIRELKESTAPSPGAEACTPGETQ